MADQSLPSTVSDITRQLGVTTRQVEYAIRTRSIPPTGWVGASRVYDAEAVRRITAASAETATHQAARRAIAAVTA
jgi:hypothetical protein